MKIPEIFVGVHCQIPEIFTSIRHQISGIYASIHLQFSGIHAKKVGRNVTAKRSLASVYSIGNRRSCAKQTEILTLTQDTFENKLIRQAQVGVKYFVTK